MQILVHLHTVLQRHSPAGRVSELTVDLPADSTVLDVIAHLEISMAPRHMMVLVNGRVSKPEAMLEEGDTVNLIPAISGG